MVQYDNGGTVAILYQFSHDLQTFISKEIYGSSEAGVSLSLAIGDFAGRDIRVGPPVYESDAVSRQLVAVINEPPKHQTQVGQTPSVNLNNSSGTNASFSDSERNHTNWTLGVTGSWSLSGEVGISLGITRFAAITTSLNGRYGRTWNKNNSSRISQSVGYTLDANNDDQIMYSDAVNQVWEYPVYSGTDNTIQGYLMVVWPTETYTQIASGKDPSVPYMPNHETGNLLSYPTDVRQLTDYDNMVTLCDNNALTIGDNDNGISLSESLVASESGRINSRLGLGIGASMKLGVRFLDTFRFGLRFNARGHYSSSKMSTHTMGMASNSALSIYFSSLSQDSTSAEYTVRPYVYWSLDGGYLVVDYVIEGVNMIDPSWWKSTYILPDLGFNLPWISASPSDLRTYDITFDPSEPKVPSDGTTQIEPVTIYATIHNYSLVHVDQPITVRFYQGDPDLGLQIDMDQTVNLGLPNNIALGAFGDVDSDGLSTSNGKVSVTWTPTNLKPVEIWVVIDPEKRITDLTTSNNSGYNIWPLPVDVEAK